MRFNISRRVGKFGKINARNEKHGPDKVEPATDVPVQFTGTKRDLDMMVRNVMPKELQTKISDVLYVEKMLAYPDMSPIKLNRKPENLDIVIYDQATKKGGLKFQKASVKNITIECGPRHQLQISLLLQLPVDPDTQAARLYQLMDQVREFEIVATQDDLFDTEEPAADEEDTTDAFPDESQDDDEE